MLHLKVGDVVLYFNKDILPTKKKLAVCVYNNFNCNKKVGLLLINSENRKMYHCAGPFQRIRYRFLRLDSYVSCSRLFEVYFTQVEKIVGSMNEEDMGKIYENVKTSKTLEKQYKELILRSAS